MAYPKTSESAKADSGVPEPSLLAGMALPKPLQGIVTGGRGVLIGLGLGLAIAFIGGQLFSGGQKETEQSAPPAATAAAQSVSVSPVQPTTVDKTLTATGTVEAYDLLAITPQIGGLQIRSVLVREGDRVSAGQPLAILDDATLQAQIRQAEAQIRQAEAQVRQQRAALAQSQASWNEAAANLTRYRTLADRGAISDEELDSRATQALTAQESIGVAQANVDSAQANVASLQANLVQLQTQLRRTIVRSPSAGTIATSNATQGDVSSTSNVLFQLIGADQLELAVEVPQTQLSQITVGAPVIITNETDDRIQLEGAVRQINPLVDAETRVATVTISLPSASLLRPGMFLNAQIVIGTRSGLVVPVAAVLPQSDGSYQVYRLNPDDTVSGQTVDIGDRLPATERQPARIEILEGLTTGTQVVSQGASYLQDGDRVNVVDDDVVDDGAD